MDHKWIEMKETNISHLEKRRIIDSKVPSRVNEDVFFPICSYCKLVTVHCHYSISWGCRWWYFKQLLCSPRFNLGKALMLTNVWNQIGWSYPFSINLHWWTEGTELQVCWKNVSSRNLINTFQVDFKSPTRLFSFASQVVFQIVSYQQQ